MKLMPTAALEKDILADLTIAAGTNPAAHLAAPYLAIYTNNLPIDRGNVIGDVTEPAYTGYARVHITAWEGPYQGADGKYAMFGGQAVFQMDNDDDPTVVLGVFLVSASTAGVLLAGGLLDQPYPLDTSEGALVLDVKLQVGEDGSIGTVEVLS